MKGEAAARRQLVIVGIVSLVFLAGCGGGTSQSLNDQPPGSSASTTSLTLNPTPSINTISPSGSMAGFAVTITLTGTNFVAGSMVNFGGAASATTFVNSTQLTAAIPAAAVASAGIVVVTVTNPAPGGGTSNPMNFTTTSSSLNPVPTISTLYPSCAPAGEQFVDSVDTQLAVIAPNPGTNFVAGSVVRWNGSDRPTTSNGTVNALTAQISAS